jgi:hypothetical protein
VTHPSEPNYLALFSGSTQGVTDDSCPHTFSTANLGSELIAAGGSFIGYSEDLPAPGSAVCTSGAYARKHNPWVNFSNLSASVNQPWTSFPTDFNTLPTVSIVVPNQNNDMHNGTIQAGDTWLQQHLDAYAQWAKTHNSLLIVTYDEDDSTANNQIPTIFFGPMVNPGRYSQSINHYNVLRTLEEMYGLPHAANSATALPITDVWNQAPTPPANLAATAGDGQVLLDWDPSGGAASYNVKRSTARGGPYAIIASGVTATSFTDNAVVNGTPYYYVVSAVNSLGESANSSEVAATPGQAFPPDSPTALQAIPTAKKRINLNWTQSVSPAIVQNRIYRGPTAAGPFAILKSLSATTSYADTKLTSRVTYYYVVTAVDADGLESAPSNQAWAVAK